MGGEDTAPRPRAGARGAGGAAPRHSHRPHTALYGFTRLYCIPCERLTLTLNECEGQVKAARPYSCFPFSRTRAGATGLLYQSMSSRAASTMAGVRPSLRRLRSVRRFGSSLPVV